MLSTRLATLCLCGAACVWCSPPFQDQEEDAESVFLIQTEHRHVPAWPSMPTHATVAPTILADAKQTANTTQQMLNSMEPWIRGGFWAKQVPPTFGCGKASFHELGMTIPEWRKQHPTEDGFCYFQNYAFWFNMAGVEYSEYGTPGRNSAQGGRMAQQLCGYLYFGEDRGPEWRVHFDTTLMEQQHLDSCLDAVDDPYCYSLGWMKGQRLDQTNIWNGTEWRAKAVSECERIQETFHFIDEEVTVGAHVFGTPVYLAKSLANALGKGPPLDDRMYNMHAYTKCQLGFGGAPGEMAYCYYKGCVKENGKISHGPECGYEN